MTMWPEATHPLPPVLLPALCRGRPQLWEEEGQPLWQLCLERPWGCTGRSLAMAQAHHGLTTKAQGAALGRETGSCHRLSGPTGKWDEAALELLTVTREGRARRLVLDPAAVSPCPSPRVRSQEPGLLGDRATGGAAGPAAEDVLARSRAGGCPGLGSRTGTQRPQTPALSPLGQGDSRVYKTTHNPLVTCSRSLGDLRRTGGRL